MLNIQKRTEPPPTPSETSSTNKMLLTFMSIACNKAPCICICVEYRLVLKHCKTQTQLDGLQRRLIVD